VQKEEYQEFSSLERLGRFLQMLENQKIKGGRNVARNEQL
jgi:hypothetical protein